MAPDATFAAHQVNPAEPVPLDNNTFCACDHCHDTRKAWTDKQPSLIEAFNNLDAPDDD